eukprot:645048-Amphidinium_carterae.1
MQRCSLLLRYRSKLCVVSLPWSHASFSHCVLRRCTTEKSFHVQCVAPDPHIERSDAAHIIHQAWMLYDLYQLGQIVISASKQNLCQLLGLQHPTA